MITVLECAFYPISQHDASIYTNDSLVFASLADISVLSYVDLRRLSKVELLIGGLLHQVEQGVFKHEFHEVGKRLFHEHTLAEQFAVVDSRNLPQLVFVFRLNALVRGYLVLLVGSVFVGVLGCVSFEHAHGRLRLVCDSRVIEAGTFCVAVAQHCIKIISFENIVHCFMEDVFH